MNNSRASEEDVGARLGMQEGGHDRKMGGGGISFAPVTTDHKNPKGRKKEKKKERRGD